MLSDNEIAGIAAVVMRVWPNSDWQPEHVKALSYQVRKLPLDMAQVEAAITFLAGQTKWKTISVKEIGEALARAANVYVERQAAETSLKSRRVRMLSEDVALQSLPHDLRHEALFRVDAILRHAGQLSRVGKRIQDAARLAEADWETALRECAPFRHEVRETPAVAKWLETAELPEIDIAKFDDVCTTT